MSGLRSSVVLPAAAALAALLGTAGAVLTVDRTSTARTLEAHPPTTTTLTSTQTIRVSSPSEASETTPAAGPWSLFWSQPVTHSEASETTPAAGPWSLFWSQPVTHSEADVATSPTAVPGAGESSETSPTATVETVTKTVTSTVTPSTPSELTCP